MFSYGGIVPFSYVWLINLQAKICKYFSIQVVCHNILVINVLENLLFCIPKAAVLQRKTYAFTVQNSHFRNAKLKLSFFSRNIFTSRRHLSFFISLACCSTSRVSRLAQKVSVVFIYLYSIPISSRQPPRVKCI